MGRRKLISATEAESCLGLSSDEDSLIRHYTLDPADRLECEIRRRPHNKLVFAIQLCVMRQTGRILAEDEQPTAAIVRYIADQLGVGPHSVSNYAYRKQTRFAAASITTRSVAPSTILKKLSASSKPSQIAAHLRRTRRQIPGALLKHVSPLSWEHINLTDIYAWDAEQQMPEGVSALRLPGSILCAA